VSTARQITSAAFSCRGPNPIDARGYAFLSLSATIGRRVPPNMPSSSRLTAVEGSTQPGGTAFAFRHPAGVIAMIICAPCPTLGSPTLFAQARLLKAPEDDDRVLVTGRLPASFAPIACWSHWRNRSAVSAGDHRNRHQSSIRCTRF
jgi:hypothetical protein